MNHGKLTNTNKEEEKLHDSYRTADDPRINMIAVKRS